MQNIIFNQISYIFSILLFIYFCRLHFIIQLKPLPLSFCLGSIQGFEGCVAGKLMLLVDFLSGVNVILVKVILRVGESYVQIVSICEGIHYSSYQRVVEANVSPGKLPTAVEKLNLCSSSSPYVPPVSPLVIHTCIFKFWVHVCL